MNTNENIPKAFPKINARLSWVQKISKCIRLFIQYGCPLIVLGYFVVGLLIARGIIAMPPAAQPTEAYSTDNKNLFNGLLVLCQIATLIVYLAWYYVGLKLFRNLEEGRMFTSETVRWIQIFGGVFLARFLLEFSIYFCFPLLQKIALHTIVWSDLFTGFFIVCIAWIMDEGRKIREEQELTV